MRQYNKHYPYFRDLFSIELQLTDAIEFSYEFPSLSIEWQAQLS
jgi:hypothetical protein